MLVKDVNNIEDVSEKVKAFGWHVVRINGHDFNELKKTFAGLKNVNDRPKMIIADTIKGKGVSFMEKPETEKISGKVYYKWHSGAPDDDSYLKGLREISESIYKLCEDLKIDKIEIPKNVVTGKTSSKSEKEFVKEAYGEALVELAKTNDKFVVLDGDLSADCGLRNFEYAYPDRFIENGIAEQDMVSTAGGLARMGLIPIVNTFGSFLAARANEQIYNNAGEKTKIIYTCHFSGIIPAGPGKSHQSVRDISLFGALPNVTILQPCNAIETKLVVEYCINEADENCVIRLVIGPSPETISLPGNYELTFGKGTTLTHGNDAVMFAYGPVMLHEALLASKYLQQINFGLKIINMPWLNKFDLDWLTKTIKDYSKIFVLEDHSVVGGLGDRILEKLSENKMISNKEIIKLGLSDYPECGTPWEVLQFHGLDGMSLAKRISGRDDLDKDDKIKEKYTTDAPQ
jgi:transketolase